MHTVDYKRFRAAIEDLDKYGFKVTTRDGFFFVGLDTTHKMWESWGLVDKNTLSGGMATFEQVEAWADGFLASQQFYSLAAKKVLEGGA